jgi:hypothetical protein
MTKITARLKSSQGVFPFLGAARLVLYGRSSSISTVEQGDAASAKSRPGSYKYKIKGMLCH